MKAVVVVFGREPVAGRVKTRLADGIGATRAALVYGVMLENTLEVARATGFDLVLSLADSPSPTWDRPGCGRVEVQRGADLGSRMSDAFDRRFREGYDGVVIIGSDCPRVQAHHIREAVTSLGRTEVVLGPGRDGGYWLVAQVRPGLDLFTGIPWSSPDTLEATRNRLSGFRARWIELAILDDVDDADDLHDVLADPALDPSVKRRLEDAMDREL